MRERVPGHGRQLVKNAPAVMPIVMAWPPASGIAAHMLSRSKRWRSRSLVSQPVGARPRPMPRFWSFGRLAAKAELDIAYIRGLKATRMNALLTAIHAQIAAFAQAAENSCVAISETSKQSRECLPETAALYATRCRHRGPSIAMSDAIACRDRAVLQITAGTILNASIKSCSWPNGAAEHTLLLRLGPIE
jgi:hypothetical protein